MSRSNWWRTIAGSVVCASVQSIKWQAPKNHFLREDKTAVLARHMLINPVYEILFAFSNAEKWQSEHNSVSRQQLFYRLHAKLFPRKPNDIASLLPIAMV